MQHTTISKAVARIVAPIAVASLLSAALMNVFVCPANAQTSVAISTETFGQRPANEPVMPSPDEIHRRRLQIRGELNDNQTSVEQLYELLDETSDDDDSQRNVLESEIQQYDDRSDVLFEELDSIDRHGAELRRRAELQRQAERLDNEASQLRHAKYLLPAKAREAKANSLRRSLANGTWKLLDDNWLCDNGTQPNLATKIALTSQVEKLKDEAALLQAEVERLRKLVEELTGDPQPKLILTSPR